MNATDPSCIALHKDDQTLATPQGKQLICCDQAIAPNDKAVPATIFIKLQFLINAKLNTDTFALKNCTFCVSLFSATSN